MRKRSNTKEIVLATLRSHDGFISGESICRELGVSRTIVWKAVCDLKDDGYTIEGVTRKGYRLVEETWDINCEAIDDKLNTKVFGRSLECIKKVDSTNAYVKRKAEDDAPHGFTVVTDQQTQGRGRKGREWVTHKDGSIAMSFLMRPDIVPDDASMLTLVGAIAVTDALRKFGVDACIKWPNDVVVDGKKVCGILTELSMEFSKVSYVVMGIGVNVLETKIDGLPDATSIAMETGLSLNRNELVACILNSFEKYYDAFISAGNLKPMKKEYEKLLVNTGKEVKIVEKDVERIGVAKGIDERGKLIVDFGGKKEHIYCGEVSVRGLYGYV